MIDESRPVAELTMDELVDVIHSRTAASIVTLIHHDPDGQRKGVVTYLHGSPVILLGMERIARRRFWRSLIKDA